MLGMRSLISFSALFCVLISTLVLQSCQRADETGFSNRGEQSGTKSVAGAAKSESQVHTINLPYEEVDFPSGPGKQLFVARCAVCHSLRYVTMQPDFPEKTWVKEVDKMRKTFGAHCTDSEAKDIVAYLMLVRGKK